jgi:SAM-dependent methyltransferase
MRDAVCHDPGMSIDDRFEDLVGSLGGFYRTWFIFVGLELGLLRALRDAGDDGLTPDELARRTETDPPVVAEWVWGADAHDLVMFEDARVRLADAIAETLLETDRPEYLGGQFTHAATAALDYGDLLDFVRTGRPVSSRPDRYRLSIERLTVQDVAVFFQEALASLPQLVADLATGGRVVDVHCGGGRWLIAMARRFPELELVGIEFEPDSVERARRNVAEAGLSDRITIEHREMTGIGHEGEFVLAYYQYALHALPDPASALRSSWAALRPGGRIVALDWYLPTDPDEFRSRHGELIAGVQLDELFTGRRLVPREEALGWFAAAGIPDPQLIDLPSGASMIVAQRADGEG